jgi:hypothetical protein
VPFDLSQYETVAERLERFWADYPAGRIYTELVNGSHAGESVIMAASVYKDKADLYPDATGYAQETPGEGMVNKTSWVENCETSAIGRALANMGYAPKGGHRSSREEMVKAAAPSTPPPARRRKKLRASQIRLVQAAQDAEIDDDLRHRIIYRLTTGRTQSVHDLNDEQADQITKQLAWFQMNRKAGLAELEKWETDHA